MACACLDTSRRRFAQYSDKKEKPKSNVKFNLGFSWRRRRDLKGYAPTRVACRALSSALARLCSLALWLLRYEKTILNRFFLLPLASRVVSYRLRLLGSAHSRFGSFATKKRYLIVFSCSPLPNNRRNKSSNPRFFKQKNKTDTRSVLFFWRRRRDLNSRAGYIRPTPLAGAPLRPT